MAIPNGDYPNGFSKYADFISKDPEQSVYRRYRRLSSLNLLYLQAELRVLEDDLSRLDFEDLKAQQHAPDDAHLLARSYDAFLADLEAGASSPSSAASLEKMRKIKRLRELMKEYLPFQWNSPLLGLDYDLFDNEKDLVALKTAQGQDRSSIFLLEHLGDVLPDTENMRC
ncbi:hypothetical protein BDD12DRAFT_894693 [Trichophaea hybrida]|nr:hypothetical protein BDD12DRAFT_894693 [Trichophaea hybrida]